MTVEPTGNTVATWEDLDDGLGDVAQSDLTIPRLSIVHKRGLFKDSSTGIEFEDLNAIFLGVVKQRIMWDKEVDEGDKPQCKSPDFNLGFPQMRTDIDASKQFPWDASDFDKSVVTMNEEGCAVLTCASCNLKEWTKKGTKSVKPLCSEQWSMPLFYFLEDDETPYPAIISFQRSGAKSAKTYAGSFKAARQPMFTVLTSVTLTQESRGTVDFCTPNFKRGAQTDPEQWREYSEMYKGVRQMLHQPPRGADSEDGEDGAASSAIPTTTKTASAPPRRPPSAQAATALKENDPWDPPTDAKAASDEDLPF